MEILNLKSTITDVKNSLAEFNSIFKWAEERISRFETGSIEIMQDED